MQYITTAERFGMEKGWFLGHKKGCEEGRAEGLEKGNIIGQIRLLQEIQGQRVSSKKNLFNGIPRNYKPCSLN